MTKTDYTTVGYSFLGSVGNRETFSDKNLHFRKKMILGPIHSITALAFIDLSRIGNENDRHNRLIFSCVLT